jgi:hypothetical protein
LCENRHERVPVKWWLRSGPRARIDDALVPEAHVWAANRRAPTLLIAADPAEGLTRPVIEQALQWARDQAAD